MQKIKMAKSIENNRAARAEMKAANIAKQMTLGKDTVEKLDAIEYNNKIVEAVQKITKPRMAEMLMIYRKTVRVNTPKETFWLYCIVALNALGVLKNSAVV